MSTRRVRVDTSVQAGTAATESGFANRAAPLEALNRKIEACCPPPIAAPPCTYEPCKAPGKPPSPTRGGGKLQ